MTAPSTADASEQTDVEVVTEAPTREIVEAEPQAPLVPGSDPGSAEGLIAQAIAKDVPVETMERLLAMRRELKAEAAKEAFDRAMAAFQAECPVIEKKKGVKDKNGKLRYKFAPIDSIVEQVRLIIAKHGLSYSISTLCEDGAVTSTCRVKHSMGHMEESSLKVPIDPQAYMNAAQKVASASTFSKRYAFCNAFGIMTGDEDDDATSVGATDVQANIICVRCRKAHITPDQATAAKKESGYAVCDVCLVAFRMKKVEKKDPPAAPPAETGETAGGNPKGTVTQPQLAKIHALTADLGKGRDHVEGIVQRMFKCRISGLSKESAAKVIEALERKVGEMKSPDEPITPDEVAAIEAEAVEPEKPNYLDQIARCSDPGQVDEIRARLEADPDISDVKKKALTGTLNAKWEELASRN